MTLLIIHVCVLLAKIGSPPPASSTCPDPPTVEDATLTVLAVVVGGLAHYTCRRPLVFPSGSSEKYLRCNPGGTWSALQYDHCAPLCPSPPPLANGHITDLDGYTPGNTAIYICDGEFRFLSERNSITLQCTQTPTSVEWVGELEECVGSMCPPPQKLPRTSVVFVDRRAGSGVALYAPHPEVSFDEGENRGRSWRSSYCLGNMTWTYVRKPTGK